MEEQRKQNKKRTVLAACALAVIASSLCIRQCKNTPEDETAPISAKSSSKATGQKTDHINNITDITDTTPAIPAIASLKIKGSKAHGSINKSSARHIKSESHYIIHDRVNENTALSSETNTVKSFDDGSCQSKDSSVIQNLSQNPSSAAQTLSADNNISFPHRHLFRLGIRFGGAYSRITRLGNIVESYDTRPMFSMDESGCFSPTAGLFITWQYRRIGAELGADYLRLSGRIKEYRMREDITEKTTFHYNYIAPQLMFRFYAYPKFYISAGARAAIPFGSRHIDYANDRTGEVYRQQSWLTQYHLRDAVKSHVVFMPSLSIGYTDAKSGLEASLEYSFGATDILRTEPNDYGYSEISNNAHWLGLTIGYSIPLNK